VRQLLFDTPQAAETELARAATEAADHDGLALAITKLTPTGADLVGQEIGRMAAGFLDMDITDVIAAGWSKNQQLAQARQATAATPGSESIVTLATHTLRSDYRPAIDVLVDGVTLTSIDVHISLATTIDSAVAVVRDGRLTALQAGACTLTATVTCEGITLAERRTTVDLPAALRLPRPATPPRPRPSPVSPHQAVPPDPAEPPIGLIQNGWRYRGSGQWEHAAQHQPGDIVNGHRLNAAGTVWEPLGA
jgi:hypothetical protein